MQSSHQKKNLKCGVIVLAAGQGKRMRSTLPKVLHLVCGEPMIVHILREVFKANATATVAIVVGHGRDDVETVVRQEPAFASAFSEGRISFVLQVEQRGTGDAARCAMETEWGSSLIRSKSPVVVLPGDLPLISAGMISQLMESLSRGTALRLLTCHLPDPTGYGRVVRRGKSGPVLRIVEEKDANAREKLIREVATSIYSFDASFLRMGLSRLSNKNAQGEFYLTDLIGQAARSKKKIDVLSWAVWEDLRGVNDLWELTLAESMMNQRMIQRWAKAGVRFLDPKSVRLDSRARLSEGVVVYPGVILEGSCEIKQGVTLGPSVYLKNVQVGENVHLKNGTCAEDSQIAANSQIGPYAHLRPGSLVGESVKIGNFVELKKSKIGARTSIAHLSYLGDAEVGERVNIGCGFVTCNFDGRVIDGERKHRTLIEDDVFLGSDCQAVAPVKIGKGAYIASGSTITEDVEPESLAIARCRQVNKPGYAKKLKG